MEYTKDMILQVRYGDVNRTLQNKKTRWTSKLIQKIQKHKLITATVISAIIFIGIDMMLITNFIHVFSKI